MCGCLLFTNLKQMLHATGRQTNKTQIISVTYMINKRSSYASTNTRTQINTHHIPLMFTLIPVKA